MNIKEIIRHVDHAHQAEVLSKLLERFLSPAFGALPKREIDLMFLDALEELEVINKEPSIYELVQKLKITRSKARSIFYERELRRIDTSELDNRIRDALKKPLLQKQGELFVLELDNPLVIEHLKYRISQLGYATDGSFSSSLVKLSVDALVVLVESIMDKSQQKVVKSALVKAGGSDASLRGLLLGALKKVGAKIADEAGEAAVGKIGDYMESIFEGTFAAILKQFAPLYGSQTGQKRDK